MNGDAIMRVWETLLAGTLLVLGVESIGRAEPVDSAAAERGRVALTTKGFLKTAWKDDAYRRAGASWEPTWHAPDPTVNPAGYHSAFRRRYGVHAAPFPNEDLPMGLRRGELPDGTRTGLQIDCLVCHGGSIGGTSMVGLGNTTLDLDALLRDLTLADGGHLGPALFNLNTARGTNNAGQIAAVLFSMRNADLSPRRFPIPLGANLPELDVPAWWLLGKKATMYYDGRTDARSARAIMQFLLGEKSAEELKALEPTFLDILAYLKSIKPPSYPFSMDRARAERGKTVFEKNCVKCHGTYGPEGNYPNRIVELKVIGTDPARAHGLSDRLVAHYNATWFGGDYQVETTMTGYQAPPLDGLWATAPYLHNGSVPTLQALLKSSERPARFTRPPSTDFEHYDTTRVGWKHATELPPGTDPRFLYDTSKYGLGNGGHTFGDKLSDPDRDDLIEYLKTL